MHHPITAHLLKTTGTRTLDELAARLNTRRSIVSDINRRAWWAEKYLQPKGAKKA